MVSNLDDKVRESLRGKILSGEMLGGAHLSELKLSKEFNVSRTPIREALCALAADGLIEMVPHRGAFVRERNAATIADMKMVYSHLISLSTRLASEKAGIETLMGLESTITGMTADNYTTASEKVIELIRTAAASEMLAESMSTIEKRLGNDNVFSNTKWEDVQSGMNVLLTAFKRHKADVAEKTMRDILSVQTTVTTATDTQNASVQTTESTTATNSLNA